MARVRSDPETGQNWIEDPVSGKWKEASREEAQDAWNAEHRGGVENLIREIGSNMQDTAGEALETIGGGGALGDVLGRVTGTGYVSNPAMGGEETPLARTGVAIQEANDGAQRARYAQHPGIGAAAMILDPTNFIPVGAGARAAASMTRLGRRAGERVVGETTAKTVRAAEEVVGRSRVRVAADEAAEAIETRRGPWERGQATEAAAGRGVREGRGIGAQVNPNAPITEQPRVLEGMLTPAELDDLGNHLDVGNLRTRGDTRALEARVDTGEIDAADELRHTEELNRSNVALDRVSGGIGRIRENQEAAITRLIANELGEGQGMRLTSENFLKLRKQSEDVFQNAAAEAGDIRIRGRDLDDFQEIPDDLTDMSHGPVSRFVDSILKDVSDDGGQLRNGKLRQYRTTSGRRAVSASNAQNFELAQAYRDVQSKLDALVDRNVSKATQEALSEARRRWRIIRSIEQSPASIDPAGKVNLKSFVRSYQKAGNRFYQSTSRDPKSEQFGRALETFNYLLHKVEPSSGSGQRILHNMAGRIPFSQR